MKVYLTLARKDQTIEAQKAQIKTMLQALLYDREKLFGPSTEVSKSLEGQLSLSDTAQALEEELAKEQKKSTVPEHTRKARQLGVNVQMLSGLVQEIEEYIIPETDTCRKCGSKLKIAGKRIVRTEVEFVPAKLKVKQIVQQVAKCTRCRTDESEYDSCCLVLTAIQVRMRIQDIGPWDITSVLCWAHCSPAILKVSLYNNGKEIPGSKGAEGREYINCLFKVEKQLKDLPYEERKQKCPEASRPILDAFWTWVSETSALKTTNEKLTVALRYSTNQRGWLKTFLEDG